MASGQFARRERRQRREGGSGDWPIPSSKLEIENFNANQGRDVFTLESACKVTLWNKQRRNAAVCQKLPLRYTSTRYRNVEVPLRMSAYVSHGMKAWIIRRTHNNCKLNTVLQGWVVDVLYITTCAFTTATKQGPWNKEMCVGYLRWSSFVCFFAIVFLLVLN